jgi:hypothetical protein
MQIKSRTDLNEFSRQAKKREGRLTLDLLLLRLKGGERSLGRLLHFEAGGILLLAGLPQRARWPSPVGQLLASQPPGPSARPKPARCDNPIRCNSVLSPKPLHLVIK